MVWGEKKDKGNTKRRKETQETVDFYFFFLLSFVCSFFHKPLLNVMDSSGALIDNKHVIRVPEYFYAVDINYLTHMIGKTASACLIHITYTMNSPLIYISFFFYS